MPLYEYICESCEKTTEVLRPMAKADAPLKCEHCGSARTKRAQSVFAAGTGSSSAGSDSDFALPMGGPGGGGGCGRCGDPNGSCEMN